MPVWIPLWSFWRDYSLNRSWELVMIPLAHGLYWMCWQLSMVCTIICGSIALCWKNKTPGQVKQSTRQVYKTDLPTSQTVGFVDLTSTRIRNTAALDCTTLKTLDCIRWRATPSSPSSMWNSVTSINIKITMRLTVTVTAWQPGKISPNHGLESWKNFLLLLCFLLCKRLPGIPLLL